MTCYHKNVMFAIIKLAIKPVLEHFFAIVYNSFFFIHAEKHGL